MTDLQIKFEKTPYDHIIIDNVFSDSELKNIFCEIDFLTCSNALKHSSFSISNASKKNNFFCNLNDLYKNIDVSPLATFSNKLLNNEYIDKFSQFSHSFNFLKLINSQTNFISYYENNDYYDTHIDNSVITLLFYFKKENSEFKGGELNLGGKKSIKPKNNRCVIITGCSEHSSSSVEFVNNKKLSGMGKYCFAKFLTIDPDKHKKEHPANILNMIVPN